MNFLNIAQASLAEVGYCIHAAVRLGYLAQADADAVEIEIKQVGAPLAGLIKAERKSTDIQTGAAVALFLYVLFRLW